MSFNPIPHRPGASRNPGQTSDIPRESEPITPGLNWAVNPAPIQEEVRLPEGVVVGLPDPFFDFGEDPDDPWAPDAGEQPEDLPDAWLTLKVYAALAIHFDASALSTSVETDHGVVTLSGSADSQHERREAARVARAVKGVKGVDNRLQVFRDRFSA